MASSPAQQNSSVHSHGRDAVVERLRAFLSGRVSERVTLKELSRFLGYSEKYASDVFQRYMGRPFSTHLKELRLDKATSMLREERHTITKIAESVGFSDAFAFSHFFKRAVGCSPTEYRRQQLRQADMA
jgi:AraC-like DNA-binding protein